MNAKIDKRTEIIHSNGGRGKNIIKPKEETLESFKILSGGARALLDIYYSVNSGWNFHDEHMSSILNVTIRRYKELRTELINHGYLYIAKGPMVNNYYVGRKAVTEIMRIIEEDEGHHDS